MYPCLTVSGDLPSLPTLQTEQQREAAESPEGGDDVDFTDMLMAELDDADDDKNASPAEEVPETEIAPEPDFASPHEARNAVPRIKPMSSPGKAEAKVPAAELCNTQKPNGQNVTDHGINSKKGGDGVLRMQPTAQTGPPQLANGEGQPGTRQGSSKVPVKKVASAAKALKSAVAQTDASGATAPEEFKSWDVEKASRFRKGQKVYQVLLSLVGCITLLKTR